LKNAVKMNVNLYDLDGIVISHGHIDHTWGLSELVKLYTEAEIEGHKCSKPTLTAHPDAFLDKNVDGLDVGSLLPVNQINKSFPVKLSKEPVWLTDKLVFLGEIERNNSFEAQIPIGKTMRYGIWEDDFLLDDSALAYKYDDGLIIITGCSHSGICNIVEYAKKVCNEQRVYDIIGGFHLLNPNENQMKQTVEYFKSCQHNFVYAGHCTDLHSKIRLAEAANVKEVGVGLVLEY
jgi:7,8-dihydropterin-6-yl-methyl-4-(beta-D-ribofuranosyl)aminobenzene 5'-phosphate synthase